MKRTYYARVFYSGYYEIEVEAQDKDEAEEIALDEAFGALPGNTTMELEKLEDITEPDYPPEI